MGVYRPSSSSVLCSTPLKASPRIVTLLPAKIQYGLMAYSRMAGFLYVLCLFSVFIPIMYYNHYFIITLSSSLT